MKQKEVIERLAKTMGISNVMSKTFLKAFVQHVPWYINTMGIVHLPRLGLIAPVLKKPRHIHNPANGITTFYPLRDGVKFKAYGACIRATYPTYRPANTYRDAYLYPDNIFNKTLSENFGFDRRLINYYVYELITLILMYASADDKIVITNLGKFYLQHWTAKAYHSLQDGSIQVRPAQNRIAFRHSKALKDAV